MYPFVINTLFFNLTIVLICETILALGFGARKNIITVVLTNILTNPPVVFCALSLAMFLNDFEKPGLYFLEIVVVWLEGFIYSKFETFSNRNPYLISLILNLTSFSVGELINILM